MRHTAAVLTNQRIVVCTAARAMFVSFIFGSTGFSILAQDLKPDAKPEANRIAHVRELLLSRKVEVLESLGSSANSAYLAVLKDQQSELFEFRGDLVLDMLIKQKADRSAFLPLVRKLLTHKDSSLRSRAAVLVGDIGKVEDAPLLVPLLSDESEAAQTNAAQALAKIGTYHELETIDNLLAASGSKGTDLRIAEITKWRNRLEDRLVSEKKISPGKKSRVPPVDAQELERIRKMLGTRAENELQKVGPALNPFYLVILEDEKTSLRHIYSTLWLLGQQNADRAQFAPVVGKLLRHSDGGVRRHAADLMGDIGSAADAAMLIPLLTDEVASVQCAAAPAIAKIGTATELEALELRLKARHPANDADLLTAFATARDSLRSRLDDKKKPK